MVEQSILSYLAQLLGGSPSRVSEYLSGKSEPTLKVAPSLMDVIKLRMFEMGNVQ